MNPGMTNSQNTNPRNGYAHMAAAKYMPYVAGERAWSESGECTGSDVEEYTEGKSGTAPVLHMRRALYAAYRCTMPRFHCFIRRINKVYRMLKQERMLTNAWY